MVLVQVQQFGTGTRYELDTSVAKGLRLKVRRFLGLVPTFLEVTEEKLVQGAFLPPPILNSVKANLLLLKFEM